MSNKSSGTNFEKEFARILADNGFWVRLDKGYAQTCDMFASRNNTPYLIECKVCNKDYFDISRVEDNQTMSRERFFECGNTEAWFAFNVDNEIYLSKKAILKPSTGIHIDNWLKCTEIWEMS
jgi:Holliday junction resolvase